MATKPSTNPGDLRSLLDRAAGASLTMPTININGTSPQELLDQYQSVVTNCGRLMKSLEEAGPHGRDYRDPGHLTQAAAEHKLMYDAAKGISEAFEQLAELAFSRLPADAPAEAPQPEPTKKTADPVKYPQVLKLSEPVFLATKGKERRVVTDATKKAALKEGWAVRWELFPQGSHNLLYVAGDGAVYDNSTENITLELVSQMNQLGVLK